MLACVCMRCMLLWTANARRLQVSLLLVVLGQWSMWKVLFCAEGTLCSVDGKIEARVNQGDELEPATWGVWIIRSLRTGDEKIMLWQLALFSLVYPNTHTHFLSLGCFWESEVMFLVPTRKRATLQVPFQLSLRDRSGYVIAWGNKWHRTRPYIIRLYANTSPQQLTFTQSWGFYISQL